ncbi:MAG: GNAT family N-acetyltransferase [Paludibacter sp.]
MNIVKLEWDSNFFCKRIGKLDVSVLDNINDILVKIEENKTYYDLLYIFSPEDIRFPNIGGLKLVDRKVVFRGDIERIEYEISPKIKFYNNSVPNKNLIDLAIISAQYSRFKIDEKFNNTDYLRLYNCWITNSVNKTFANAVLCYYDNDIIIGMITLKIINDVGVIGLLAVDTNVQNKGIASQLINAAKDYLFKNKVFYIEVATQIDNEKACHLYMKNNLTKSSVTNIYHFWL